jgi:hypothetical protein
VSPRRDKRRIEPETDAGATGADELSRRQRRKQAKAGRGPAAKGGGAPDPTEVLASITGDAGSALDGPRRQADPDVDERRRRRDRVDRGVPPSPEAAEIASLTTRHRTDALAPSGPEPIAPRMRAFRFPALLVVVALLVGAVLVERREAEQATVATAPSDLSRLMPVASAAGTASSTFYCAGGTARGSTDPVEAPATGDDETATDETATDETDETATDETAADETDETATDEPAGEASTTTTTVVVTQPAVPIVAEHTVLIGNLSGDDQQVVVTAMPSEGEPVSETITVAAHTRATVLLSDLVTAPFAAALVETDGGAIAVEHQLDGPTGRSIAPCASSASSTWYFPTGSTRLGTRHVYAVFNPFPQQAVVDFSFMVDDEGGRQITRDSDQLEGIVVPPGSVVAVDITDVVTVHDQVATTITTRSGLGSVVVDQLQVSDGDSDWPENLSVTLGAPAPAATWLFADNRPLGEGLETTYVAFNPGSTDAELELYVVADGQVLSAPIEPFVVTVRAGQYATVPLGQDTRIPVGFGAFVVAVSGNGAPVVVERVQRHLESADPDGAAYTMGSPLLAREWLVPVGGVEGQGAMQVSIANPSVSESVTFTVEAAGEGDASPLQDFDDVSLAPGARTVVDLSEAQGAAALMLRITASGPVVASQWFAFDDPGTLSSSSVFPVVGTLVLPGGEVTDRGSLVEIPAPDPLDGTVPTGTVPPGTDLVPPGTDVVAPEETTTTTTAAEAPPVTDPATGAPVDPGAVPTTVAPG